jgi:hypothetical protein
MAAGLVVTAVELDSTHLGGPEVWQTRELEIKIGKRRRLGHDSNDMNRKQH